MMTKVMQFWANEVKKAVKNMIIKLTREGIAIYILRMAEEKARKITEKIVDICERNGWDSQDYLAFNK